MTVHAHSHAPNRFAVIPTPERLMADDDRRGRGITMAFLDSGFTAHPDLTRPVDRIAAYVDVWDPAAVLSPVRAVEPWEWHGTQTSVVCAGNGWLSDGVYRGLASEARLVLVRVSDAEGRVTDDGIVRGLRWVLDHHARLGIHVVNLSLGGDVDVGGADSEIDQLAGEAVSRGLVLVVAAGNAGCTDLPRPIPPANAPPVITVGGYDDKNEPGSHPGLYCSSFGPTADGVQKPEIIAPAMWVAAPIPAGTPEARQSEALSRLESAPDYRLRELARELWCDAGLPEGATDSPPHLIRAGVEHLLLERRVVAIHYRHVDGTSFAAPIVASVVAQMLEANPRLSPAAVKRLLIETGDRLPGAPPERQGYGMLNARRAVDAATAERHGAAAFAGSCVEDGRIVFRLHADAADTVAVTGDFNGWNEAGTALTRTPEGLWRAEVPLPPAGRCCYKFIVDGRWVDDPANGMKEPDPYGGFNSVIDVTVENSSVG